MSERRPLVAANWKMNKSREDAESFLAEFLPRIASVHDVDIVVCPPYLALETAVEHCFQTQVKVAAQNMHAEPEGAYTGEVSAPMLLEVGAEGVILGHSERRRDFGETDTSLRAKLPAALSAGLLPILCVGETEEERDAGETERKLRTQVQEDLEDVPVEHLAELVIAYEPIWAIGTGRTATAEQAQEAISFVRALVGGRDGAAANAVRILYGGSVTQENATELLASPDIDGALVGGASLDPAAFAGIVEAARP
jgi:triosephosphate isomerase (TIM)